MIEVEYYRRVAERTVGRTIRKVRRAGRLVPQGRHDGAGAAGRRSPGATVTGTRPHRQAPAARHRRPTARAPVRDDRPAARRRRRARSRSSSTRAGATSRRGPASPCGFDGGGDLRDGRSPSARRRGARPDRSTTSGVDALARASPRPPRRRSAAQPGPAQGVAARPEPRRRRRQPPRRRDPLAGRPRPGPPRPLARRRRGRRACTARCGRTITPPHRRRAAATPATSRSPGCGAPPAPGTAPRSSAGRSAVAPPTPAPSTSAEAWLGARPR